LSSLALFSAGRCRWQCRQSSTPVSDQWRIDNCSLAIGTLGARLVLVSGPDPKELSLPQALGNCYDSTVGDTLASCSLRGAQRGRVPFAAIHLHRWSWLWANGTPETPCVAAGSFVFPRHRRTEPLESSPLPFRTLIKTLRVRITPWGPISGSAGDRGDRKARWNQTVCGVSSQLCATSSHLLGSGSITSVIGLPDLLRHGQDSRGL